MAIDFNPPPFKQYIGTPYGMPISLCTPIDPSIGPKTVPLTIDWSLYGASSTSPVAIQFNLLQLGSPGQVLDRIRSIYIDNSFSFVPIYVYFPDTQFMVICPANSTLIHPVFANDSQKFVVYAQNFLDNNLPITVVHISNVPVEAAAISTGQFVPPVLLPTVSFLQNNQFTGGGVLQTYAAENIGTPDPARTIYVATYAWNNRDGSNPSATGVTLGGNAMTLIGRRNVGNSTRWVEVSLWAINIAAGTNSTVAVTYSVAPATNSIDIFAAYNLVTPLVDASLNGNTAAPAGGANASYNYALTTPASGIALVLNITGDRSENISGIQNITMGAFSSGVSQYARGQQQTAGATLNILASTGGSTGGVGVAASLGATFA